MDNFIDSVILELSDVIDYNDIILKREIIYIITLYAKKYYFNKHKINLYIIICYIILKSKNKEDLINYINDVKEFNLEFIKFNNIYNDVYMDSDIIINPNGFNKTMIAVCDWLRNLTKKVDCKKIMSLVKNYVIKKNNSLLIKDNVIILLFGCVSHKIIYGNISDRVYVQTADIFDIDEFMNVYNSFISFQNEIQTDIVFNRRCNQIFDSNDYQYIIDSCSKYDVILGNIIGQGSDAIVFYGLLDDNLKVAVRFNKTENEKKHNIDVAFSYNMGILGIGPNIIDIFYYQDTNHDYNQVIIMEYFKYDGNLVFTNISFDKILFIIESIINLMYIIIYEHKFYCVDIKPSNFVINENIDVVKMIDFDSNNCFTDLLDKKIESENHLFQILLFQLHMILLNDPKLNIYKISNLFNKYYNKNILLESLNISYNSAYLQIVNYLDHKDIDEIFKLVDIYVSEEE